MFKILQTIGKSKISFYSIILASLLSLIFMFSDLLNRPISQFIEVITSILILTLIIISLLTGLKGLKKKNSYKWMAQVGVVLSSIFILFLILAILYVSMWAFL